MSHGRQALRAAQRHGTIRWTTCAGHGDRGAAAAGGDTGTFLGILGVLDIPASRHEQPPIQRGRRRVGGGVYRHRDLAIVDPAQGARVLPGRTRRVRAVLGEPGVINHPATWSDQIARLAGQRLAHRHHIPGRGRHELLQLLMIHLQPCRHGLHRLSSSIQHQPTRIQARLGPLITTLERREDLGDKHIQRLADPTQCKIIHPQMLSRV